jgi:GxxExxY protein
VEIKSVEALNEAHEAQCLTYLKFSKKPVCLLINFNTLRLKDGIRRFAGESNLRQIQRVPGEP